MNRRRWPKTTTVDWSISLGYYPWQSAELNGSFGRVTGALSREKLWQCRDVASLYWEGFAAAVAVVAVVGEVIREPEERLW